MSTRRYDQLHANMADETRVEVLRTSLREIDEDVSRINESYEDVVVTFEQALTETRVEHTLGETTRKFTVMYVNANAAIYNGAKNPDSKGLWLISTVAPLEVEVRVYRS